MLKAILMPRDGSRKEVSDAVSASSERVQDAATRFEQTIRGMIEKAGPPTPLLPIRKHPAHR
jgi:hypothetical protein